MGITLHFFDDDFNYVSLVIGFRKFLARHLAVNLKSFINKELTKLEILDKVIAITADNASDIVKATSNGFGVRFSCFCHNLNLALKPLVKNTTKNSTEETEEIQVSEEEYESESECESQEVNDAEFDLNNDEADEEEKNEEDLEDEEEDEEVIVEVQRLLSQVRNLVRMIRKCGNICSFAQNQIRLSADLKNIKNFIIDFHIRWNSTFLMLQRLVKLKDIPMQITDCPTKINGITKKQIEKLKRLEL